MSGEIATYLPFLAALAPLVGSTLVRLGKTLFTNEDMTVIQGGENGKPPWLQTIGNVTYLHLPSRAHVTLRIGRHTVDIADHTNPKLNGSRATIAIDDQPPDGVWTGETNARHFLDEEAGSFHVLHDKSAIGYWGDPKRAFRSMRISDR
ncbi:MAG TPA: hypothetical protein VJB96_05010 [Patescibacteria group bacterium]|nr:hypothetical protein [Patescibacteria group bacterium]